MTRPAATTDVSAVSRRRAGTAALFAIATTFLTTQAWSATGSGASGARKAVLLQARQAWNGKAYTRYPAGQPELVMLKLTIPARTALPWHTHPIPNAAYVLSGTITVTDRETGRHNTFHAGEAFAETVDDVHRGVTGPEPVVLIVTYAASPGMPTSIPAKGARAEY